MIKGLHHNAYRCRDSEETRRFYEDFLGLPLAGTLVIDETKTGRRPHVLHTFYRMDDGSYLAFFEAPDIAVRVQGAARLRPAHRARSGPVDAARDVREGKGAGIETRGVIDHHFIHSIYFRDPNGYVIELTARTREHAGEMDPDEERRPRKARPLASRERARSCRAEPRRRAAHRFAGRRAFASESAPCTYKACTLHRPGTRAALSR
jgi:catechol 2,3-dioxygenase-like lactoylglutathione lyase family enzyme